MEEEMKQLFVFLMAVVALVFLEGVSSADDDLMRRAKVLFKPIPHEITAVKDVRMTPERVVLGKALFFDPRLSKSGFISCNSCHNIGMGGADFQQTAVGHGWQKGPRNSPTVLNSVFNIAQFWDGRAADLKEQAKGPVQASVEMNNTPDKTMQ